ncbi:error-prone DNA polymerase [Albimonas sp. CAU 1670]|uniref:error-prone DNA polymerase n=1 Tax=Albimonas sp. CAU 1670 TaxID=3032599 RepID=UPI0023D99491|nr:error-prone DNA polymerase [Albimonas sp. CAU 1670]MDF2232124.1 error-prone DNA polymerase [Albimonas sp. CAU 1670]
MTRIPELHVTTNFSFLVGASHPEEFAREAAALGLSALAVADRNSVAGVVRAHQALRDLARAGLGVAAGAPGQGGGGAASALAAAPGGVRTTDRIGHADVVARARARRSGAARDAHDDAAEDHARDRAALRDAARQAPDPSLPPSSPSSSLGSGAAPRPGDAASPAPAAPAAPRPGGVRPDASEPDVSQPGVSQPELSRPEASRPDASQPDGPTKPAPLALAPVAPLTLPRLIPGALLALRDGQELVALPTDRAAWARLTRLLTLGKRRAPKGECWLDPDDVLDHAEGLILLWRPSPEADPAELDPGASPAPSPGPSPAAEAAVGPRAAPSPPRPARQAEPRRPRGAGRTPGLVQGWARRLPGQVFVLAAPLYDGRDAPRLAALARLAEVSGAPLVASASPIMHVGARRRLADVLSCIREGTTIDQLGRRAQANAERRLRAPHELARLFADHPEALTRAQAIAERCRFSLDELRYEYPDEVAGGEDPQARLERLTAEGLRDRYPEGVPARVRDQAAHELALISRLNYAPYFLTVRDLVAFAESRGILCQGRGSAANSIVCYALRVTAIGPDVASMVFERFVSEARDEPPDIDVDFEHERREEVIQHIYQRYGRHRAGLCATVIHYRARRAVREVGKAMGLSADAINALASQIWGWSSESIREERIREIGLDPTEPRLRKTLDLVAELIGFPRHLSQHVGGFIITKGRLDELVPIENAAMEDRTVIEWDKDDIDALGILKVDVLSLGMLTCIRKAFELIERHAGETWGLATLPPEDPAVYDMLCEADSIGVFQVESRAQMNFLPRMRPRCFYDLVIEVAIVRPGPIQGDMVHPYLRRRRGEEQVSFPSDELGQVLGKTLGVPLFQEQAMQIAIIGAGFTPEEADLLRRALATFRKSGTIHNFRDRFLAGMTRNGYDLDFAERCFSQIEGFGEYGFPESHAASFALLVYASAWIKRHHPAAFACALLNSQPMGFYAPAQIVRDARMHGVAVRPVCVNASYWDNTLEPDPRSTGGLALRLGFRQLRAMKEEDALWLTGARGNGYRSVEDAWRKAGLPATTLGTLAEADAFASLGLDRRQALWQAKAIPGGDPLPLFAGLLEGEGIEEPPTPLPAMSEGEEVVEDYVSARLTLRAHPVALLRDRLTPPGSPTAGGHAGEPWPRPPACLPAARLDLPPEKARVCVCGLVIVRQRPGSAGGVIFITLEDESGVSNIVVWARVYEAFRRQVIAGRLLRVTGRVQRDGSVVHVVAETIEDLSPLLDDLARGARDMPNPAGPVDEVRRPVQGSRRGSAAEDVRDPRRDAAAGFTGRDAAAGFERRDAGLARGEAGARHPRHQSKKLFPSRDFH